MIMMARVGVGVSRALGSLTLLVWAKGNIIEPAGCKGLWGYGGWFRIRNHFDFFY